MSGADSIRAAVAAAARDRAREAPLFLVGAVRSGTTLLRLLLGHHPELSRCEEIEFLGEILAHEERYGDAGSVRRFLELDRQFRASGLDFRWSEEQGCRGWARDLLEQIRARDGVSVATATLHHHFSRLPGLWPDARYLFLHRDPRDVSRSCVAMGWAGNCWGAARIWLDAQRELEALRERVPRESLLELRFEDLVQDPVVVLERICGFLSVPYQGEMLEIERDTTYRPPDPSEAASWRDSASELEVRMVETRVGPDRMRRAGYTPSDLPPLPTQGPRALWYAVTNRAGRLRFRLARYGAVLVVAQSLVARLPWEPLQRWARRRTEAVDVRHLK